MQIKTILMFITVTLGILLGVGGMLWQFGGNPEKPILNIAGQSKHSQGPSASSGQGVVTIVEFSDFQCPACLSVQEPLKQILKKYEGKVQFVYRFFPLVTLHKNAQISAQAAEAAGMQDKFWEMHDKLFATQNVWQGVVDPKELFEGYARELGINTENFLKDLNSQEVKDAINVDVLDATRYQITGTPTFYVNGIKTEFGKIDEKIAELTK